MLVLHVSHVVGAMKILSRLLLQLSLFPALQFTLNGVDINASSFTDNIRRYGASKMADMTRNLTTLLWSSKERANRSLHGGVSNRFPNAAPKDPATPSKINVILGMFSLSVPCQELRVV